MALRDWKGKFLSVLRDTGNVRLACSQAMVSRTTAYKWKGKNKKFQAEWEEAIDDAIDALEAEAVRRGRSGTDKPIYYKGVLIDTVKEYSDTLLIFLLKAHRPEKFRDRYQVEHSGKVINLNKSIDEMSMKELQVLIGNDD